MTAPREVDAIRARLDAAKERLGIVFLWGDPHEPAKVRDFRDGVDEIIAAAHAEAEAERERYREALDELLYVYELAKPLIQRGDDPIMVPFLAVHAPAEEKARAALAAPRATPEEEGHRE